MALLSLGHFESSAAQVISVGVTHQLANVFFDLKQDLTYDSRAPSLQLSLQILATRLRSAQGWHFPTKIAEILVLTTIACCCFCRCHFASVAIAFEVHCGWRKIMVS
jgi:hypothetical protein